MGTHTAVSKIVLRLTTTLAVSRFEISSSHGKEHPYGNHEKCEQMGSDGNGAARTVGVCPGCGFRVTRDIVFRRCVYPYIDSKSVNLFLRVGTYIKFVSQRLYVQN